jgi:cytochrome c biogenesis protein ResB
MELGETLRAEPAVESLRSRVLNAAVLQPLRAVWWLFTNVRFAMFLLAGISVLSLIGVVVPQVPAAIRGDPALEDMWLRTKEDTFGFLTDPMERVGLFDIFHARWFAVLMGLTVASTCAYILSRIPGVWASIAHPRKRVPDRYFEMAPVRVETSARLATDMLEANLRRQRYSVERSEEGGTTYLFADRFQLAQLGTLLTHAAVIVFILSAVVSKMDSFEAGLFLAEGETEPVFPVRNPQQLQVELVESHGAFGEGGVPLDYRSDLVVYKNGEEVKRCSSTVNSPCGYGGYSFFQAAWYGFGAALQVRDTSTGNVVYRETLALSDRSAAPEVVIQDSDGNVLLSETVVLTDELTAGDIRYRGKLVELSDGRVMTIGLRDTDGQRELLILEPDGAALALREGETEATAGLTVTYVRERQVPSAVVEDLPLPADGGVTGGVLLQMTGTVYGTPDAAAGDESAEGVLGVPQLTVSGLEASPATLGEGEKLTLGEYEYEFLGQREFSGIQVKRDRSDYLVWGGAGLIVLGLMITFWVPRRRLWAKISSAGSALAGQAPAHADYSGELRSLAHAAGAPEPDTDQ